MKFLLILASLCFLLSSPLFSWSEAPIYTLYRNSETDDGARIHVATFDVKDARQFNIERCQEVQELYEAHAIGVKTRFWCEEGKFRTTRRY